MTLTEFRERFCLTEKEAAVVLYREVPRGTGVTEALAMLGGWDEETAAAAVKDAEKAGCIDPLVERKMFRRALH